HFIRYKYHLIKLWLICVDRRINGGKRWIHDNTEIIEDSELREEYLKSANIVILGARVVNTPAPKIITEKEFRLLPTFATIVDVAIDEGGNCVYSKPTPPSEAPYVVDGRKIYAIPNLPGTVPERSSPLISAAMLPYIKKLVHHLVEGTPLDKCLVNSVITKDSKI
ncbi:MAG: hypothetical protein M1334_03045, partial [Patescibacteria group bacterium]|nr:hypothetical protein [Patescibacteria group bacterium]